MAATKMYNKSPKIEKADGKGDLVREAGNPSEASDDAKKSAGNPESHGVMDKSVPVVGDVETGTDGIETHHVQAGERDQMHGRHMVDHADMRGRHEKEHTLRATGHHRESHDDMNKRHHGEKRTMHSRHEREMKDMGERHAGGAPDAGMEANPVDSVGGTETAGQ